VALGPDDSLVGLTGEADGNGVERVEGRGIGPGNLTAHLRKSALSVASNIAEGCGREGERELARFLRTAAGSASETEYPLLLARDLRYLAPEAHRHTIVCTGSGVAL
jgi:hypothetical protein